MKNHFDSYYLDAPLIAGRVWDLFIPEKITGFPALFFVHGGGWEAGSRTGFHRIMEEFNRRGFVCAATDYRMGPGVDALMQLTDIRTAYEWFARRLAEIGSPPRIAVFGTSAGAHLASLLLCAMPGECGEAVELTQPWLRPELGLLQSTPATFRPWPDIFPPIWSAMQRIAGVAYADDPERYRRLSLETYIRADNPRLFFLEAGNEHMFPAKMNQVLVARHRAMNIPSRMRCYDSAEHGFLYDVTRRVQREALTDMEAFLRGNLPE